MAVLRKSQEFTAQELPMCSGCQLLSAEFTGSAVQGPEISTIAKGGISVCGAADGYLLSIVLLAVLAGIVIGRRMSGKEVGGIRQALYNDGQDQSAMRDRGLEACAMAWEPSGELFCPVCRAEYIAGTSSCEDCGVELVDEGEVPERDPPIEESVVRVFRIGGYKAQLVRQFLAANGIPCTISRAIFSDTLPGDVYVFESDVLRAKRLIRDYLSQMEGSAA